MKLAIPSKVVVKELVSSRYKDNLRPADWDRRVSGIDTVETDSGRLTLFSDGSQSPPTSGWTIIVMSGDEKTGYRWTLYALPRVETGCTAISAPSLH